jgi:cation diffusion facilitator CzcD-associated flavoprotein CzcO
MWAVEVERGETHEVVRLACRFLYLCTGYYDYESGYTPAWSGVGRFAGRIVHPQKWSEDVDYAGKRVIVIGSGATAVTLVPAIAEKAAHVTMLQRSPTYIVAQPSEDRAAVWMRRYLPKKLAYQIARWKSLLLNMAFYHLARWMPNVTKRMIVGQVRDQLGVDYDVEKHFTPRYKPWDERLCLVPDADLFSVIKSGKASVVTDEIETFTEQGIRLRSGQELCADVIVTATGLVVKLAGGMQFVVDGVPVEFPKTMSYKGAMFSDVPNLAYAFGYTNASWTLKCELTAKYVCRLLNYMDLHDYRVCVPRRRDQNLTDKPILDFSSGYVRRALHMLPRQGSKPPWKLYQNYLLDLLTLHFGRLNDGALEFSH